MARRRDIPTVRPRVAVSELQKPPYSTPLAPHGTLPLRRPFQDRLSVSPWNRFLRPAAPAVSRATLCVHFTLVFRPPFPRGESALDPIFPAEGAGGLQRCIVACARCSREGERRGRLSVQIRCLEIRVTALRL